MLYISDKIRLGGGAEGTGVFAAEPILPHERIVRFALIFAEAPGRHTLQVDETHHIAPTGREDDCLNHACSPSAYVDFRDWSVRAIGRIETGSEVTINYNTTEWEEPFPFDCRCGALNCVGRVRGFRHLPPEVQADLLPIVSPHLRRRYRQSGPGAGRKDRATHG